MKKASSLSSWLMKGHSPAVPALERAGGTPETCQWTCMTQLTRLALNGDYVGRDAPFPPEVSRRSSHTPVATQPAV